MRNWFPLIFLLLFVACTPDEEVVTTTAVFPPPTVVSQSLATLPVERPSQTAVSIAATVTQPLLVTETTVPPTASKTAVPPTSTYTPRPTITPSPTPSYPDTQNIFRRVALLPVAELTGRVLQLRLSPSDPTILQLIAEDGYQLIDLADGTVLTFSALANSTLVALDNQDGLWTLPAGGQTIDVTDPTNYTLSYGAESGWLPAVGSVTDWIQDGNGHLWLATDNDVRRFDGTRWVVYSRADMGMPPSVLADALQQFTLVFSPLTQTVWVGSCDWGGPGPVGGGGVRWFDGTLWHGSDAPTATGCVTQVAEGKNGRIWVPLDAHLWRFHPADSSWQQFTPTAPPGVSRIGYTEQLLLDDQGNPWPLFSLCGGASCQVGFVCYRLRDGQWTQIGEIVDVTPTVVFDSSSLPTFFYYSQMIHYTAADEPQPAPQFELSVITAVTNETNNVWLLAQLSPDLPLAIWHAVLAD